MRPDLMIAEGVAGWWGVVPVLTLAGLVFWRTRREGWWSGVRTAVLVWVSGIWVASNALGLAEALRPGPVRVLWALAALGAWACWWSDRRLPRRPWPLPRDGVARLLAAAAAGLLLITLVRAVLAPPSTVDVLNYHLPRQVMWLQQGSLDFYATANDRENMMPPLAEVIGLQFLALTGDDGWSNLPQWGAYALAAWLAAGLVRRWGGGDRAAFAAALAGLLLPMSYHEASNAKNDLLAAAALLLLTAEVQAAARAGEPGRKSAWRVGAALALALLVKSTAFIIAPWILLAGLVPWVRRAGRGHLAVAAAVAIALCAPFYGRNLLWYGTPLGEHRAEDGGAQAVAAMGPGLWVSNAVRQATLHALAPSENWNAALLGAVARGHEALGADVDDERVTLWGLSFAPEFAPASDVVAGAPAHFWLGGGALLWVLARRRAAPGWWLAPAVLLAAASFPLILKWQPWMNRLEQGVFWLGIVAVAACWPVGRRGWRATRPAMFFLVAAAWVWSWGADTEGRRLLGPSAVWRQSRAEVEVAMTPRLAGRAEEMAGLLAEAGAERVQLHALHDAAYPLQRELRRLAPGVQFVGAPVRESARRPDALVMLVRGAPQPLWRDYAGAADWRLVGDGLGDGVYLPAKEVRRLGWMERLPEFAGWTLREGLIGRDWRAGDGTVQVVREWVGDRVELAVGPLGAGAGLRASLLRPGGRGRERVWVSSGDRVLGEIELGEAQVLVDLAFPLPASAEASVVALKSEAADPGVFTRLRVVDQGFAPGGGP